MKKTLSFAAIHMGVAFTVGFAMTGDVWVGGMLALVEPCCNTVAYYFHERFWQRHQPDNGEDMRLHTISTNGNYDSHMTGSAPSTQRSMLVS